MTADARTYDIVLFGATGFVGKLTAGHLAKTAPPEVRIALAGRSRDKLESVRSGLGPGAAQWAIVVADAGDDAAMAGLAASTKVVVTTVGPYAKYGMPLVKACAEAGTHYADLTGEVLFVRRSADAVDDVARSSGAKVVHACGFDSIPSDLGVLLTAERAAADGQGELGQTVNYVRQLRGGFSGGTIDSMRTQAIESAANASDRKIVADPYGLSPDRGAEPSRGGSKRAKASSPIDVLKGVAGALPVRRTTDGHWTGPFVMASFNTRIVRRSNALLGHAYGRGFRYQEVMDFGTSVKAPAMAGAFTAGLLGVAGGMSFRPTRTILDRVLPKPGEGPSVEAQERGRFRMEVESTTTTGARYRTTVAATADPGYSGTAIMLGQSALCLALDTLPDRAGVLTPATAMGDVLAERLRSQGFTLTTERLDPAETDATSADATTTDATTAGDVRADAS